MKMEIKDFENLLEEFRSAQTAELLSYKKNFDTDIINITSEIDEVKFGHSQLKTMIRN